MLERVRETFGLTSVTLLETRRRRLGASVAQRRATPCARPGEADTEVPAGDGPRSWPCAGGCCRPRTSAWSAPSRPRRPSCSTASGSAGPPPRRHPWRRPTRCAPRCWPPSATTSAPRWPRPRPSVSTPAQPRRRPAARTTGASCCRPRTTSLDRLAALVDNLLDMSRLQAGAMSIDVQPTAVDEVVARPSTTSATTAASVVIDAADDLPLVQADPGLLERVLANLVANALRYSPAGRAAPPDLQPARRPGRDPGHRPRPRHPARRLGPGLPAVPAPRRHRQHHRHRPRPGPLPRA